jgi:hypothetical protein
MANVPLNSKAKLIAVYTIGSGEVTVVKLRALAFIDERKPGSVRLMQESAGWLWCRFSVSPRRRVASRATRSEISQITHHAE